MERRGVSTLGVAAVLDVGGADSDAMSRLFGDLGDDDLNIELPGGAADRVARPTVAGTGGYAARHPLLLHQRHLRRGWCAALPDRRRTDLSSKRLGQLMTRETSADDRTRSIV
jgi:hypothetical protein